MTSKFERNAVAQYNEIKIVSAEEGEAPDFWLTGPNGAEFPIHLTQLHDILHALDDLHDKAHHH